MKLEREPVFGQLSYKPEFKSFDHNDINHNSRELESANWIRKESQNMVPFDPKNNGEDAGHVDAMRTCDEGEIKRLVPVKLESLEKQSDYYMDKSVTEYDLPELEVCYKESSCNTIKDICVDEGVPSQEKIPIQTNMDEDAFYNHSSPDEIQKPQQLQQQMDIVMTVPEIFEASAQNYDVKEDFGIPINAEEQVQREEMKDKENEIVPATTESLVKLDHAPSATEVNCHVDELADNSKVDDRSIVVGVDRSAPISISRFPKLDPVSSIEQSNGVIDEISNDVRADEGGSSTCGVNCSDITKVETQNLAEFLSDDICGSKAQPLVLETTITREECPEVDACQRFETSSTLMVDEDISDSEIASTELQHSSVPSTIAKDECPNDGDCNEENVPVQVEGEPGESSFSAGVPFATLINFKESTPHSGTDNASSAMQHDQAESGVSAVSNSSSLVNSSGPTTYSDSERFLAQRDLGESSFAAVSHVSSLINSSGPIPYSGSISLRSDSSTTSTRSFAFPVMYPHEPFSSPVRMAKADKRLLRKHRGWKRGIFCCTF